MNLYRASLADSITGTSQFTATLTAGTKTYVCRFMWPDACQEQMDILQSHLNTLSDTDPIGPAYNRAYNWSSFYLQFQGLDDKEIEELVATLGDEVPSSFKGLPSYQLLVIIHERLLQALEYEQVYLLYKEALRWQVTVECDGLTTVAVVQPGGWYNFDSGNAFRFVAGTREYIDFDDLKYVEMEFDIDE